MTPHRLLMLTTSPVSIQRQLFDPPYILITTSFPRPCSRCLGAARSTAAFFRNPPAQQSCPLNLSHQLPSDRWLMPHPVRYRLGGRELTYFRSREDGWTDHEVGIAANQRRNGSQSLALESLPP